MKRYFLIPLLAAAALAAAIPAGAAAPLRVSFQGKLDDSGQPVTGTRNFVFKIYDALTGGTLVWTSQTEAVGVSNGVFSVVLETGTPVNLSTGTFAGPRFIEITVDGTLLSPREAVVSSPYALVAQSLAVGAAVPLASLEKDPSSASTVNTATNPVDWSQLKSVPAGFADGADDSAGALTVKEGGATILTPVTTLDFDAAQFATAAAAPSMGLALDPSSVTLQGNAFNAASQLVQLDATGKLPSAVFTGAYTNALTFGSAAGGPIAFSTNVVVSASLVRLGNFASAPNAASPGAGAVYFNTGDSTLYVSNGGSWSPLASGGASPWTSSGGNTTLVTATDNVGLNVTPTEKLHVNGNIKATGVIIAGSGPNTITTAAGLLDATKLSGTASINTSGSAATLATPRAINGQNFDGSAAITVPVNSANDTTNAATMYPLWTTGAGNNAASISTTKLSFVPNTGILTATGFVGNLTGSVTGSITGSAATLATPRAINGTNFDGSAAITVPVNSANDTTNAATMYPLWTTGAGNNAASISTTKLSFVPNTGALTATTFVGNLTGNASGSAATLTTSRNINGTGFNGSADITVPVNSADDTATNATMYPLWTTAVGNNAAKVSTTKLSFNPSTGLLTATGFSGPLTGSVSGNAGTTTKTDDTTSASSVYPVWATGAGSIADKISTTKLSFVPNTGALTATTFVGNLTGNASGSAATLATPRAINGQNFDGSAAITVPVNSADDVATNATMYPLWTTATGNAAAKVSTTKLYFNPSTGLLTATGFSGPLTGTVTGSAATLTTSRNINGTGFNGSADITVPVNSANDTTNAATMYPLWTTGAGNNAASISTTKLSFVPNTGALTATTFVGNLTGNASGSAATLTTSRNINGTGFNGSADITVPVNSTDDTATSSAVYPLWTTAAGNTAAKISTTKISLVPADGTLSLTGGVTASSATTTGDAEIRGGLTVGGGTKITKHLSATFALNSGLPASPGCVDLAGNTVTGAALGDTVAVSADIALPADFTLQAFVSAANTVAIRWCQLAGGATDPDGTGATYRVDVWKH